MKASLVVWCTLQIVRAIYLAAEEFRGHLGHRPWSEIDKRKKEHLEQIEEQRTYEGEE